MENSLSLDSKTYIEIQKLIKFIDFISSLKYSTVEDKENCNVIKEKIKNVNNSEKFTDWNICLDIYDENIRNGRNDINGIYWKTWAVHFERATLVIEAKTKHSADNLEHYGNDFYYYSSMDFNKAENNYKSLLKSDVDLFINDAMNFESYTTEHLNEIEIDVST